MTTEHRIGNRVLNLFLRIAFHRYLRGLPDGGLRDSQSGFWVFRRCSFSESSTSTQDGMAFSEELKIEAILRGCPLPRGPDPATASAGGPPSSRAGATGPGTSSSWPRSGSRSPARRRA